MVSVEGVLDNSGRQLSLIDADDVTVKKSINKDGKIEVEITGKAYSLAEYHAVLQSVGFLVHNTMNFVMQGKVKVLGQMEEQDLFHLFTNLVGTAPYSKAREESEELVDSTQLDEKKSLELLEEFREKLTELEIDKEDFKSFAESLKKMNRYLLCSILESIMYSTIEKAIGTKVELKKFWLELQHARPTF